MKMPSANRPSSMEPCSFMELWNFYESAGFLYQEKSAALTPWFATIADHWDRVLNSDEELAWCATVRDGSGQIVASESNWRANTRTWTAQHLVSRNGNAFGVLAAVASHFCEAHPKEGYELWFRPTNKFPVQVFGEFLNAAGQQASVLEKYDYFVGVDMDSMRYDTAVEIAVNDLSGAATDFMRRHKSAIVLESETLLDDPFLTLANGLYDRYGLSISRTVYSAFLRGRLIGMAFQYQAPLGLNFSFLENRCEVVLDAALSISDSARILAALMCHIRSEPGTPIPFVASGAASEAAIHLGMRVRRQYCRVSVLAAAKWRIRDYLQRACAERKQKMLGASLKNSTQVEQQENTQCNI